MKINWEKYYIKTENRPPRKLLVESVQFVGRKEKALDLGAGALMDSKYLLEQGFEQVMAIDSDPAFVSYAEKIKDPRFRYECKSICNYELKGETYDLVNAQWSLPYIAPVDFEETMKRIMTSIKSGGVFTGIFYGDRDEQILPQGVKITRVTKEGLLSLFSRFEIIKFIETEEDKESAMGKLKHFHEFGIIARKR